MIEAVASSLNGTGDAGNFGVGGSSASSVWAVGNYASPTATATDSLILHWNGKAWAHVPSPDPADSVDSPLNAVTAVSGSDAWAVGAAAVHSVTESVILQWNGRHWQHVASPRPGGDTSTNLPEDIAATRGGPAWAVGCYTKSPSNCGTLAVRYTRSRWQHVASTPGP